MHEFLIKFYKLEQTREIKEEKTVVYKSSAVGYGEARLEALTFAQDFLRGADDRNEHWCMRVMVNN